MDTTLNLPDARQAGTEAGERAQTKADAMHPGFSERAMDFIRARMSTAANDDRFSGESLVNAMKQAEIVAHDDRAFGPVFAKAIRAGFIRPVGYVARVKGHGTAGGRLYAPGGEV